MFLLFCVRILNFWRNSLNFWDFFRLVIYSLFTIYVFMFLRFCFVVVFTQNFQKVLFVFKIFIHWQYLRLPYFSTTNLALSHASWDNSSCSRKVFLALLNKLSCFYSNLIDFYFSWDFLHLNARLDYIPSPLCASSFCIVVYCIAASSKLILGKKFHYQIL